MSGKGAFQNIVPPRLPEEITEELEDLRKIEVVTKDHAKDDAASKFRLRSLQKMKSALQEELYASHLLGSENDIEVSLEGKAVKGHMIDIDFLGSFLVDLQRVTDKVMFAAGAQVRVAERIPKEEKSESKMMLTGTRAASFTVQLKLAPIEDSTKLVFHERRETALSNLQELLSDNTPEERVNFLVSISASKTAYEDLLKNVADNNASTKLRTRVNPYGVRLTSGKAVERLQQMKAPEQEPTTEIIEITGTLLGGSLCRYTFEIELEGRSDIWRGGVAEDAQEQMKIELSAVVRAKIQRTIQPRSKLGLPPKIDYVLQSIYEIKPDKQEGLFD